MDKKLLDESKATLIEEDVYLEEPVEEVSEEQIQNAFTGLVNDIIKEEFALIEKYTSAISTLESEELTNKEEVLTILKSISDDKNIQVGMLTKALELINNKNSELMNAGIEKAEEIISEPASTDLQSQE
jgi:hypothetical protein